MIHWIVFSTLATGLFYGLYLWLFRRDRWLQLSRAYLMVTLAFSLVYPLLRLPEVAVPMAEPTGAMLPEIELSVYSAGKMPAYQEGGGDVVPDVRQGLEVGRVLTAVYLAGVALALAVLLLRIWHAVFLLRQSSFVQRDNVKLHLVDDDTPPCSFFNHIIIGTKNLDDEERQCILAHEMLHVRQRHTLDVLFVRLLCCIVWFNPFAWLMLRELRAVHEYLADGAVLAAHGREGYLGLLYRETTGVGYGHITHNFQSINIKKRIAMMNKTKTRFGAWKVLAVLPVAAVLMAFGCQADGGGTKTEAVYGNRLMTIDYHKEGGKPSLFNGFCYNRVRGTFKEYPEGLPLEGKVECSGEGAESSYGAWELAGPAITTAKGGMDGKVIGRNEKGIMRAIDRRLRKGEAEGRIVRRVHGKAEEGRVDLALIATWRNGKPNGDADIKLVVKEVVPITDGVYLCQEYQDHIKGGRIVERTWEGTAAVPMEEVEKVNTFIGTEEEATEMMKKLKDDYRYVELIRMQADEHAGFYMENVGNELWELCYTNDDNTWLAYKQQGKPFFTEAEFEGGNEALYRWLQANIHYPEVARKEGYEDRIIVTFAVYRDGTLGDPVIPSLFSKNKAKEALQLEAMNVVSRMPKWKPATFMGKPVDSRFYLPIVFKLS